MAQKTSLVFGCSGQDGALLSQSLLRQDFEVIGTSRKIKDDQSQKILNHSILGIEKDIKIVSCDMKDFDEVYSLIKKIKPREIYNLAAQSSVGKSFKCPTETFKSIVDITLNLLDVCKELEYDGNIFFAGSSEIFGNTDFKACLNHRQQPSSPYGIAKQTSLNLVKIYRDLHNLNCVTGILFNHESPLRSKHFVTQKIITEALKCQKNKSHKLNLGNINIARDWGWAEEYVEGMQLMNRSANFGDQILCTGKLTKLKDFLKIVFQKLDLNWRNHVIVNSQYFRKGEIINSYGDPQKMRTDLNWEAKINLEQIIERLIEFKINYPNSG